MDDVAAYYRNMKHVVVLLSASECEQNPQARCVMDVIGPFDTYEQAVEVHAGCPTWTTPHIMFMHAPRTSSANA